MYFRNKTTGHMLSLWANKNYRVHYKHVHVLSTYITVEIIIMHGYQILYLISSFSMLPAYKS